MDTLRGLIDHQARTRPDEVFLVVPETGLELTFGGLRAGARSLSAALLERGLQPGDHVAFLLENGYQAATLFLGVPYGGFVITPLNLHSQPAHLTHILSQSGARLVFVSPAHRERLESCLCRLPHPPPLVEVDEESSSFPLDRPAGRVDPPAVVWRDEGELIYTSGTTGLPKGVVLSHGNLVAGGRNTAGAHQLTAADRSLCVLPLYHINAQVVTLVAPLLSGGSVVLPRRFSASRFWELALDHRCTWLSVVPTIVSYLLEGEGPPPDAFPWRKLRFARSASAPLSPEHHRAFEDRFRLPLIETMGLTETAAPILSNPMPPGRRKIGSPGRAHGNQIRVAGPKGEELPAGEVGEILVRGDNGMKGYHRDPGATRKTLGPGGWLHTGDLAYRDADGYLFVTGRLGELIIKGGENIAPREIDEVLCRHPSVREAAAVGIPDPHYGQAVAACVLLRRGACCIERGLEGTLGLSFCPLARGEAVCPLGRELSGLCRRELGAYKSPARIRALADLPRGPSGKLQRLRLRELLL